MVIRLDFILQPLEVLRQYQAIFCLVTPEPMPVESCLQYLGVRAVSGSIDAVLHDGVPLMSDAGDHGYGHKDHKEDSAGRLQ